MTSLSSSYQETATFAKEFNGAVLVLKRQQLVPALPRPTDEEESRARQRLSAYLQSILAQLHKDEGQAAEWVPDAIIARLTEKNQSKMAWLIQDLRKARRTLEEGGAPSEQDFTALDEVCDAADATASASFRRLWRR